MRNLHDLPRVRLGVFPTPFYRLDRLSEQYGRGIWIKRDDLCGVALGGSKVRKLEFVLAEALDQGCDTVFTTGGAQSNHAALTAACAARLGMKCILLLKRRGVTEHRGNLVLDELFGAEVRLLDTDSYDEIYAEMHRIGGALEQAGHKCCYIPVGASTALGAVGYVSGAREIAVQAMAAAVPPGCCWEPGCFCPVRRSPALPWTATPLTRSSPAWQGRPQHCWSAPSSRNRMHFRWWSTWAPAMPCQIRRIPPISRNWPGRRASCWTRSTPGRPLPA